MNNKCQKERRHSKTNLKKEKNVKNPPKTRIREGKNKVVLENIFTQIFLLPAS